MGKFVKTMRELKHPKQGENFYLPNLAGKKNKSIFFSATFPIFDSAHLLDRYQLS
jgi:hypothetical protein